MNVAAAAGIHDAVGQVKTLEVVVLSALDSAGSDQDLDQVIDIARSAALGEMASGIAHELNQPLGAIATSRRREYACSTGRSR